MIDQFIICPISSCRRHHRRQQPSIDCLPVSFMQRKVQARERNFLEQSTELPSTVLVVVTILSSLLIRSKPGRGCEHSISLSFQRHSARHSFQDSR
jgi:hypothetical protein